MMLNYTSWFICQYIGNTHKRCVWARSLELSEGRAEWVTDLASVAGAVPRNARTRTHIHTPSQTKKMDIVS